MTGLIAAFVLGGIALWAIQKIAHTMAFGGRKVGSDIRQKWLAKLDYDALLRTQAQIDGEIQRRQPPKEEP